MEKEKSAFFKGWLRFWSFMSGLLQDQGGMASSKRVVVYVALIMFVQQVEASIAGKTLNDTVFYGTIATIFATLGLTIPEWFAPKGQLINGARIGNPTGPTGPAKQP
jgi:hypothetical protein